MKLYGHQKITTESLKEKKLFQVTNFPLVLIHNENSIEPIDDDKDVNCSITIINNDSIENIETKSLLRNVLAFKISKLMNFSFTSRYHPVDVILNGNFRGNYYICDFVIN